MVHSSHAATIQSILASQERLWCCAAAMRPPSRTTWPARVGSGWRASTAWPPSEPPGRPGEALHGCRGEGAAWVGLPVTWTIRRWGELLDRLQFPTLGSAEVRTQFKMAAPMDAIFLDMAGGFPIVLDPCRLLDMSEHYRMSGNPAW